MVDSTHELILVRLEALYFERHKVNCAPHKPSHAHTQRNSFNFFILYLWALSIFFSYCSLAPDTTIFF